MSQVHISNACFRMIQFDNIRSNILVFTSKFFFPFKSHSIGQAPPPPKREGLFPVKIQGDSYDFDTDECEYDNQIALSPTNVKGEGIELKNYVCNKKVIHWFLITKYSIK